MWRLKMNESYIVVVDCHNCKWRGKVEIKFRKTVEDNPCPKCGCCQLEGLRFIEESSTAPDWTDPEVRMNIIEGGTVD